jgi:hypothetical protein
MPSNMHFHSFANPERDPEDRIVDALDAEKKREKMLDKTVADSFPASDPPSTLPDPSEDSFLLTADVWDNGSHWDTPGAFT